MKTEVHDKTIRNVRFYDHAEDSLLKFAVIISKSNDKWVYCRHRARNTYEIPGGHREAGETILETAKRELYEETGLFTIASLRYVCIPLPENGKTRRKNLMGCCIMRRLRNLKRNCTVKSNRLNFLIQSPKR